MSKNYCQGGLVAVIARILVIIGGINWGLVGLGLLLGSLSNWNIVNMILGFSPIIEAIVYVLVGVSAIMLIFDCKCKENAPVSTDASGMGGNM